MAKPDDPFGRKAPVFPMLPFIVGLNERIINERMIEEETTCD